MEERFHTQQTSGSPRRIPLFSPRAYPAAMADSDQCELHEVAVFNGPQEADDLLRLARSPIGDECQICSVCRSAREFIERRLAEQAGQVFPPGQNGDAAWKKLQNAIATAKLSVHKGT